MEAAEGPAGRITEAGRANVTVGAVDGSASRETEVAVLEDRFSGSLVMRVERGTLDLGKADALSFCIREVDSITDALVFVLK